MKYLITGGAGFVGRNFIRHIRKYQEDAEITIVDDLSEEHTQEDLEFVKANADRTVFCDLRDFLRNAFSIKYDMVIHLASHVGGRVSIEDKQIYVAENLGIDQAMIKSVKDGLTEKFIYASSSAVYPVRFQNDSRVSIPCAGYDYAIGFNRYLEENMVDLSRDSLSLPDKTYGWAKLSGEYLCSLLPDSIQTLIIRPFSGYGTDQSKKYPFPSIMERVKRGDDPVNVWGSGRQMRDFIHIEDCVKMTFELFELMPVSCEAYNLGRSIPVSFIDLAQVALTIKGDNNTKIVPLPDKPEGVYCRVADMSKTFGLGIYPHITLEEGVDRYLKGKI